MYNSVSTIGCEDTFTFYQGQGAYGGLGVSSVTSLEECQNYCLQITMCAAVDYTDVNPDFKCFWFNSVTTTHQSQHITHYTRSNCLGEYKVSQLTLQLFYVKAYSEQNTHYIHVFINNNYFTIMVLAYWFMLNESSNQNNTIWWFIFQLQCQLHPLHGRQPVTVCYGFFKLLK